MLAEAFGKPTAPEGFGPGGIIVDAGAGRAGELGLGSAVGLRRTSLRASEAALKYFLLGSFAAALQLFGGALMYGATGHTDLKGIGEAVGTIGQAGSSVSAPLIIVALALSISGLAFKVSA